MKIKAYQDGSMVRVMYPNPKHKRENESDETFLARIAARTEQANPELAQCRSIVADTADLPDYRERHKWFITDRDTIEVKK